MNRLTLNDAHWNELKTAYGPAGNIPGLLEALQGPVGGWGWQDEPMFSLWSSLWHQGDVYSASYPALPYLLDAVPEASPEGQQSLLQLAACILASSVEDGAPEVDEQWVNLETERLRLERLVLEALQHPVESEEDLELLLAVLATAKRAYRIGNFLMQVDSSWTCQECGEPLPGLTALD